MTSHLQSPSAMASGNSIRRGASTLSLTSHLMLASATSKRARFCGSYAVARVTKPSARSYANGYTLTAANLMASSRDASGNVNAGRRAVYENILANCDRHAVGCASVRIAACAAVWLCFAPCDGGRQHTEDRHGV